jgi:hypothetical protein
MAGEGNIYPESGVVMASEKTTTIVVAGVLVGVIVIVAAILVAFGSWASSRTSKVATPVPVKVENKSVPVVAEAPKPKPVYDPPCALANRNAYGCVDQVYGKRLVVGVVDTVTFYNDEEQVADGHLQPDYTEVKFTYSDDEYPPDPEKFCGNTLDKFTPGSKIRMVINESKQSDYNGCYTVEVVTLTFGGNPPRRKK